MPPESPTSTLTRPESPSSSTPLGANSQPTSIFGLDDLNFDSMYDIPELPGGRKRRHEENETNQSTSSKKRSTSPFDALKAIQVAHLATKARFYETDIIGGQAVPASQITEQGGLVKEDLDTKSYAELKEMFSNPQLRALYGDDLLTATWKADFKRMTLDFLGAVDRNQVPERFRFLIDEVIENKTYERDLAALDAFDDHAYNR